MINIVIVDDKRSQILEIMGMIKREQLGIDNIYFYTEVDAFLKVLETFPPYTIFILDIVFPNHNGVILAKKINKKIIGSSIIFISADLHKVYTVYDVEHQYFIYKPKLKEKLPIAIKKAFDYMYNKNLFLVVQQKSRTLVYLQKDVYYLERKERRTYVNLELTQQICATPLDSYIKLLPVNFKRCHQSYIVNFLKVASYKRTHFTLTNGLIIPISKNYQKNIRKEFHNFMLMKTRGIY